MGTIRGTIRGTIGEQLREQLREQLGEHWNAYDFKSRNDGAYEQTVTRGAFWRCIFFAFCQSSKMPTTRSAWLRRTGPEHGYLRKT